MSAFILLSVISAQAAYANMESIAMPAVTTDSSNNMQTAMAATTASNLGVTSAAPLTTDASQANSPMDMSSHADNQPTMTMVYSTPVATPDAPMIYNTPVAMTPQVPMVYQTSTSTNAPVVNSGIKSTFSLALLMIAAL